VNILSKTLRHLRPAVLDTSDESARLARLAIDTPRVQPIALMPAIERMRERILATAWLVYANGHTYTIRFGRKWVTLLESGIGTPSAYYHAFGLAKGGAKVILRIDVCGGLSPDYHVGDLFIAEEAVAGDGFIGARAGGKALPADSGLVELAGEVLSGRGYRHHRGRIISVDHFFDQSDEEHRLWHQTAQAVDMETSGLYLSAQECGVKALSLLCISDVRLAGECFLSDPANFPVWNYISGLRRLLKAAKQIVAKIEI
jgi:purine-nucleoside phosphorylase